MGRSTNVLLLLQCLIWGGNQTVILKQSPETLQKMQGSAPMDVGKVRQEAKCSPAATAPILWLLFATRNCAHMLRAPRTPAHSQSAPAHSQSAKSMPN